MKYQVIVPVYNGEGVIEACLKSIVEQRNVSIGKDYSVLVIDDGSTDRTVEIAGRFPVEVISLERNSGRLVARLTGANRARAERLLFVDSRVTIPDNMISLLPRFDRYPAVIGEPFSKEAAGNSSLQRIFYLIRRKYYGPENFPAQEKDLLINADNFKRSPKGTTSLLIDKDLFLRLIPERTSKEVNDDTLLFHNMVFRDGIALLRTPAIKVEYDPNRKFGPFVKWLYERGVRFGDFYLARGGYFHNLFRFLLGLALIVILAPFFLPAHLLAAGAWTLSASYIGLCVYLSETALDFLIVFLGFPFILVPFGCGILRFWTRSLFSR